MRLDVPELLGCRAGREGGWAAGAGRERAAGPGSGGLCAGGGEEGEEGAGSGPADKRSGEIYDPACKGAEGLSQPMGPGSGCPDSRIVPSAPLRASPRRRPPPAVSLTSSAGFRGAARRSALALFPPLPGKQRSPLAPGPAPGRCRAGNQEAACPICQAFDS